MMDHWIKLSLIGALCSLTLALPAGAESSLQVVKDPSKFVTIGADAMAPGKVYFTFTPDPKSFSDWKTAEPVEYEFLSLFPGYEEPTMQSGKDMKPKLEKMTMYIAKAKMVIDKPASQFFLKNMITTTFLKKLDPTLEQDTVAPDQIMPVVGGSGNVPNFKKICDPTNDKIMRPAKELSLSVLQRPGQAWCSDPSRSICVQSCGIFSSDYSRGISAYNLTTEASDNKDYGMASESEFRYFVSEAEMGKSQSVAALTGINSPVRGVLEQNIFYFNQLVQYGKTIVFFQEHPTNANKTIVTSFLVFGIQSSAYNKEVNLNQLGIHVKVKDVVMSRSKMNGGTGFTQGLPRYTAKIAKALEEELSKKD